MQREREGAVREKERGGQRNRGQNEREGTKEREREGAQGKGDRERGGRESERAGHR